MYTLVSTIVRNKQTDGHWENISIGGMTLTNLFTMYSDILVTLTNPFYPDQLGLNLFLLYGELMGSTLTFNEFLIQNGNKTLPTVNKSYVINKRYARYKDAFQANYKITPVKPGASIDAEYPRSDKTSLHLTRSKTNMADFVKHCMVTVNGFFHYVDGNVSGAWVIEGNRSSMLARQNLMGLLNFQDIGALNYIKITPEMIKRHIADEGLGKRTVIDLGIDVTNKTIMLVLGGYLHLLDDDSFYRVGVESVMINFNRIPLIERYYESKDHLDLSSLPIQRSNANVNLIGVSDFCSDENIKAYLSLPQSFIVILDNPYIYLEREHADNTELAGQVISYVKPELPLFSQYGRVLDYWNCGDECGQYGLSVIDHGVNNHIFNTVNPYKQNSVSSERIVGELRSFGHVNFLRICSDV